MLRCAPLHQKASHHLSSKTTGKLEALAVLLQKLKSEGRRVLILSQMIFMLDILELFLNFHFLTYVRIDECANQEERQVSFP